MYELRVYSPRIIIISLVNLRFFKCNNRIKLCSKLIIYVFSTRMNASKICKCKGCFSACGIWRIRRAENIRAPRQWRKSTNNYCRALVEPIFVGQYLVLWPVGPLTLIRPPGGHPLPSVIGSIGSGIHEQKWRSQFGSLKLHWLIVGSKIASKGYPSLTACWNFHLIWRWPWSSILNLIITSREFLHLVFLTIHYYC